MYACTNASADGKRTLELMDKKWSNETRDVVRVL